jgi:hypothetical protein
MPNLVHATLEPNSHNSDGFTVALYFDGIPDEDLVREVCDNQLSSFNFGVDTSDEFFGFEEHPTPVSELAKLRRYECNPAG